MPGSSHNNGRHGATRGFPGPQSTGWRCGEGRVRPAPGSLWPTSRFSVSAAPVPVSVGRCPLSASSAPHRHNTPPRHVAGAGAVQSGQIQYNPSLVCRYKVATRSNEVHTLILINGSFTSTLLCSSVDHGPSLHYNCCC